MEPIAQVFDPFELIETGGSLGSSRIVIKEKKKKQMRIIIYTKTWS
jgi:hypothetical protein